MLARAMSQGNRCRDRFRCCAGGERAIGRVLAERSKKGSGEPARIRERFPYELAPLMLVNDDLSLVPVVAARSA